MRNYYGVEIRRSRSDVGEGIVAVHGFTEIEKRDEWVESVPEVHPGIFENIERKAILFDQVENYIPSWSHGSRTGIVWHRFMPTDVSDEAS